jgi:Tol biopolymer transport system component
MERLRTALADRYAIDRRLGEGGMATVYLAEDLKHKREVAVKVLRPELAAVLGAERFVQEIATTASLQHPHILPLFDSGEAQGLLYYVMPYIEGETLRGKLNRETQLSIEEAVRIATEVADALDYAHRHNVIHRDIKPENILLHDGRAMVADFGIALAISAAAGGRMTETGLSLGTPHYMSPEQATAKKELTSRSDVYSLGAVLYEMLTGEPPHTGASAQAVVMKIVTEDVRPVTALRKSVPPHVAAATAVALEKLAADRFESAAKFAAALADPAFTAPSATGAAALPTRGEMHRWKRVSIGLAAVAVVATVFALWGWSRPDPPRPVTWRGFAFPPGQELTKGQVAVLKPFVFAPDGSWLVYMGPGEGAPQLWIKRREEYEATPLAGTEGARNPVVSPSGRSIAFTVEGVLRRIPVAGGPSETLSDSANKDFPAVAWLDDGTLIFNDYGYGLRRVAEEGGPSEIVWTPLTLETRTMAITVTALPESRGVLFGVCDFNCATVQQVWALDLRSGESHRVLADAMFATYAPTGHLIAARYREPTAQEFMTDAFAVRFDLETLQTIGETVTLYEDVTGLSWSRAGTALLEFSGFPPTFEAVWVDRDGRATPIDTAWQFDALAWDRTLGWALSPDGSRLAIGLEGERVADIWIKQLDDGPVSPLNSGETRVYQPRWASDGRSVTYLAFDRSAGEAGIYTKRADGTGSAELVYSNPQARGIAVGGTADWLVVMTGDTQRDIVGFRPGLDSVAIPLLAEEYDEMAPALSPDGRWLAYTSDESGQAEVYVRPFPNVGDRRWTVSLRGGYSPLWAHSGRELFYISADDEMVAAEVETDPAFRVTQRRVLFELSPDFVIDSMHTAHDISPDDRRFIMVRRVAMPETLQPELVVVDNFFEWLKDKVGN